MHFVLAWQSERSALLRPTTRNVAFAIGSALIVAASQATGQGFLSTVFLFAAVLFFARAILGGAEMYFRHGFVPGKLGPLVKRARFNPLTPKPYMTAISGVRFPIDKETHEQFELGETLLIEHLRWSRMPVAIYRGRAA